jgi:hypothetical protein
MAEPTPQPSDDSPAATARAWGPILQRIAIAVALTLSGGTAIGNAIQPPASVSPPQIVECPNTPEVERQGVAIGALAKATGENATTLAVHEERFKVLDEIKSDVKKLVAQRRGR